MCQTVPLNIFLHQIKFPTFSEVGKQIRDFGVGIADAIEIFSFPLKQGFSNTQNFGVAVFGAELLNHTAGMSRQVQILC